MDEDYLISKLEALEERIEALESELRKIIEIAKAITRGED